MECRDARPLIARLNTLAETERVRLGYHLDSCAACRDEIEESFVMPVGLAMVAPPPDLSAKIMSRLPAVSPLALARRRQRNLGIARGSVIAASAIASLAGLLGLFMLQFSSVRTADVIQGVILPLALAAKALLIAVAQSWIVLLLALLALVVPYLLRRSRLVPIPALSARSTLAGGALVAALLVINMAGSRGDLGSVASSLDVSQAVAGDVTSLGGDIVVRGNVMGDVVALGGKVVLQAGSHVEGSVLAGYGISGDAELETGSVAQETFDVPEDLPEAFANASGANTTLALTPGTVARLGGLLAALATLLLGTLLVVIRPQLAAWGSRQLTRFPARALLLGLLTSAGLVVLALGGSVVLAATVAGVLLVPILLLLLHLPYVAGVATVGYTLGHRITGAQASSSAIWGIGMQLVLLLALGLTVPWIGLLIFYLLGTAGLGGAMLGWQNLRTQIE